MNAETQRRRGNAEGERKETMEKRRGKVFRFPGILASLLGNTTGEGAG